MASGGGGQVVTVGGRRSEKSGAKLCCHQGVGRSVRGERRRERAAGESREGGGRNSPLPSFDLASALWVLLLVAQPLLLDQPNFSESARMLDPLWHGDYELYGAATDAAIHRTTNRSARYVALATLTLVLFGTFLILSARRLRDLGRPGHYAWIALIPFVGAQALFAVLILLPGDAGENAYGVRHQGRADDQMVHGFAPPVRGA